MIRGTTAQWKSWMVVAVGVFVALVGVGTLVGMPWRFTVGWTAAALLQIGGSLGAIALGVGLAWLGVTDGRRKR